MKYTTSTCVMVASLMAVVTYGVKQRVMSLEDRLTKINRESVKLEESMHLLQAERSYLTAPKRLQSLAQRHLGFAPITGDQMVCLETLKPLIREGRPMRLAQGGEHRS